MNTLRKKLAFFGVGLSVLLSGYSIAAWRLLWGTRAYRINTSAGAILAGSRPYTTLAAFLLLVIMVSGVSIQRRVRRAERMTSLKRILLTGEKIPPKTGDGTDPMEAVAQNKSAEYAAPQGQEAPAPAQEIVPGGRTGTVPMSKGAPVPEAKRSGTVPMSKGAPAPEAKESGTVPMSKGTVPLEHVRPGQCRKCGAALKPGQRFCKDCGFPVEGGDFP